MRGGSGASMRPSDVSLLHGVANRFRSRTAVAAGVWRGFFSGFSLARQPIFFQQLPKQPVAEYPLVVLRHLRDLHEYANFFPGLHHLDRTGGGSLRLPRGLVAEDQVSGVGIALEDLVTSVDAQKSKRGAVGLGFRVPRVAGHSGFSRAPDPKCE